MSEHSDMSEHKRGASGAKRTAAALVVVAAAGVLIALVIVGVRRATARRAEEERKAAERARASVPIVRVVRVRRVERLLEQVDLSGTVRAAREVVVLPEVPGKLERVSVKRGREVRAGEVLAVVESDTLRAQLDQASAALSVAMSGVSVAKVARDNAASDRRRLRGLEKTGSASDREVEGAETMLKTAEAQVALAESRVEQAQAAVRLAQLQLKKAIITAPFAGTVADDFNHTAGAMVGPQVPIARIVEMQRLRVDLRAGERDLARLRAGQNAEISVASAPDRTFRGVVLVAGPVVDPMTRTAPVEIALENVVEGGEHLLKPGMYADVSIAVNEKTNVLAVPPSALTTIEDRASVLVLGRPTGDEGRNVFLEARSVKFGVRTADWVEVTDGLTEGELIVASGVRALAPGAEVRTEAEPGTE